MKFPFKSILKAIFSFGNKIAVEKTGKDLVAVATEEATEEVVKVVKKVVSKKKKPKA